jgi:hypothetical protein
MPERTGPNLPKAVEFGEVFDANYCIRHFTEQNLTTDYT